MTKTDRVWRERGLREAVLKGDEKAWRVLYEEEFGPLEAFTLWRSGRSRDLADDVLQETWMTALKQIRRFDPEKGTFRQWLFGIAANVIQSQLRSRKRRLQREQAHAEKNGTCHPGGEQIAEALAALPERSELVLRMKYLEQKTVAEIATEWGESEKAVESLLSRARAAFREVYGYDG
jgi:RNA polymerase sigma-70 factor (ECF subfamily)